jgi:hypothetical protein
MGRRYPLERNEKRVKPGDHFLGFVLVAIRREIYDVAEQHCNVIVAARNYRTDISNLLGGRLGKQAVEQFIGLFLRFPRLLQRNLQSDMSLDASEHDWSRERFVDVIDRSDIKALPFIRVFGLGREKDDWNAACRRICLQTPAYFIAVHARHCYIQKN